MASTRDVIAPPIFAEDASTTIPPTPIAGQSYRDPVAGPASSADGWPYAQLVNSAEWNQLMFQWSSLLSIMDLKGVLGWSDLKDYTEAAIAFGSDGKVYKWLQGSGPGTPAGARDPVSEPLYWEEFGADSADFLNTLRINVASAATIDLTSSAAATRHLNITGTATVTGFTVQAGQCYFIRFGNTGCTLVNSSTLTTQTGANIVTNAGDTCILRAISDNSVEILCYKSIKQFTQSAALPTTSGTSHEITSIPPWVNRISIVFSNVSLNNTDQLLVQIGSAAVETSGYVSYGTLSDSASSASSSTSGFIVRTTAATNSASLVMTLSRAGASTWVSSHVGTNGQTGAVHGGGNKTITGELQRIRLTSTSGSASFDAGSLSVQYEG